MKRIGTIVTIALLALMVVYLGAGTVVVECLKNNTVMVGTGMNDCCHRGEDDHCKSSSSCMKTTIVKLQPTIVAKQLAKIQMPVLSLLPLFCICNSLQLLQVGTISEVLHAVSPPHAPPRLYLTIIRVLII